ncbi:MAG: hypothetical protein MK066_11275 [Crocinitomicaceae bacterium]|nr:hypothetical protein [Crocinitomicaceae bacterium]
MKRNILKGLLTLIIGVVLCFCGGAQTDNVAPSVKFISSNDGTGFDEYVEGDISRNYESFQLSDSSRYYVPYLSVVEDEETEIRMVVPFSNRRLQFLIDGEAVQLELAYLSKDTISIIIPPQNQDYSLFVICEGEIVGKMNGIVQPRLHESITIVPLVPFDLSQDSIENYLNSIYNQANLELDLIIKPRFQFESFDKELMSNPNAHHHRYTDQMIEIRDQYFEDYPEEKKSSYYMFVIPGFVNESLGGYMVQNKAVGFIRSAELEDFQFELAHELGFGLGAMSDMDSDTIAPIFGKIIADSTSSVLLSKEQWVSIQHNCHSLSFYDDYEDVKTKSGVVAFYFWEEDSKGNIKTSEDGFLKSIRRPFKRNQHTIHLNITNYLFTPIMVIFGFRINALSVVSLILIFLLIRFFRKKLFERINTPNKKPWIVRFGLRVVSFSFFITLFIGCFFLINKGYKWYEIHEGEIHELKEKSIRQCIRIITKNHDNEKITEEELSTQLLIKEQKSVALKKVKRVLYFDHFPDKHGEMVYRLSRSSDTLELHALGYEKVAGSHYFVLNEYDSDKQLVEQKVYNHFGSEITEKLALKDPAERVLVFVNGYRPTSLGKTFEENFTDIRNNGLEFPNSKNLIYDFDRYDYWRPWKEIDLLFQSRINPSKTFYADGHFSVNTSNHRSLVSFTTLSTIFPKRCENLKKHTCKVVNNKNTIELLNLTPNKVGFAERKKNGIVAGKNLLQSLNEIPNRSENDTLFLVAHSMGFAYSQGIIEVLRGKINFGGFYIVAPENASSGSVNPEEWQEIWQYGSDFNTEIVQSPCLIDGIAPQTRAKGLLPFQQVFIPKLLDKKKGFFNSHFIGHYTWLFDINPLDNGYIMQR